MLKHFSTLTVHTNDNNNNKLKLVRFFSNVQKENKTERKRETESLKNPSERFISGSHLSSRRSTAKFPLRAL